MERRVCASHEFSLAEMASGYAWLDTNISVNTIYLLPLLHEARV